MMLRSPPVREAAEREGIAVITVDETGAKLAIAGRATGAKVEAETDPCILPKACKNGAAGKHQNMLLNCGGETLSQVQGGRQACRLRAKAFP